MTLKHRQESRLMKEARKRGVKNPHSREAIKEQLKIGEELRKKQSALDSESDSSEVPEAEELGSESSDSR